MEDLDRDENQWSFKVSGSSQTHNIYVWKVSATAVYFRFQLVQASGSDKNIFVKWSFTSNNDLMRSVQQDECAEIDGYSASSSSSSVTLKNEDEDYTTYTTDNDFKFKNFRTFKYAASWPALFGLLSYDIKKQFYDLKGNAVSTPAAVTEAYTIAKITPDTTDQNDLVTFYPNRTYCLIESAERGSNTYRKYTSIFTNILQADNLDQADTDDGLHCDSSDSAMLEVGTANKETFDVVNELDDPDHP
jgi:hypothetical protein